MSEHDMPRLDENQAGWDRAVRIGLGVVLFVLGISGLFGETAGAVLRVASLLPLATGLLGWCPAYEAFGFSTRRPAGAPTRTATRIHTGRPLRAR